MSRTGSRAMRQVEHRRPRSSKPPQVVLHQERPSSFRARAETWPAIAPHIGNLVVEERSAAGPVDVALAA